MSLHRTASGAGAAKHLAALLVAVAALASGHAGAQTTGPATAGQPGPSAAAAAGPSGPPTAPVAAPSSPAAAASASTWPIAGQQGLVRFVIVPQGHATDRLAYAQQVRLLCEPQATCFLNFYTNSTGAPVALPLADAIDRESTAVYRRSAKQGAERFMWRCSLKVADEACF